MAVYFVTGKLGAGKSLAAVGRLRQYAMEGRPIAGNLDLFIEHFATFRDSRTTYIRLPDRPSAFDLDALGSGNNSYDEEKNGLIVLDELATWFNSRNWQQQGRKELIDWFVHARKKGWDVIFLVQSIEAVDNQLLDLLMEYHVPVRRLDKIQIPVLSPLAKMITGGKGIKLPKVHVANVKYLNDISAEKWIFRAHDLYPCYDTKQVIEATSPHGTYCLLPRWHIEGRYYVEPPRYEPPAMDWYALASVCMMGLGLTPLLT